ncbi:MAG: asparagine synthase-related protein, partial [Actinomycetota bacterium]|nr:asparagine synthase-related protein [Actinomycetota bacterium]
MLRSFAAIHDPSGRTTAADRARLAAAVRGEGRVHSFVSGPLSVAWSGAQAPTPPRALPWCLLDGHVYNLEELAREVGLSGAEEPESALAVLYAQSGEAMLERLRGDFVIVVWEAERNVGFLALDQIGVRCLCFHSASGRLVFGSEVREVATALASRPPPNADLIPYWLNASRLPVDKTLHQNVRRLQSGHLLRLVPGWPTRRYWDPHYVPQRQVPREEVVHEIREGVVEAVRRRLRQHEPAAITLSGGLDSSSIAAVATQLVEPALRPVGAYSGTFPGHPSADESSLIAEAARHYHLPSTRMVVHGGSPIRGAAEYLRTWAVPPGSANIFWWFPLGRRALDDGVRVFLDGEDGDHLFGVSFFLLADLMRDGRLVAAARQASQIPSNGPAGPRFILRMLLNSGIKAALPASAIRTVRAARKLDRYVPSWFTERSGRAFLEHDNDAYSFRRKEVPRWWSY